jgi:hypothetical protein
LFAIMPPTVARLALEMSGANRNLCFANVAFRSSRTIPGSTRAQRCSTFTSSNRLRCLEVSTMRPVADSLAGLGGAAAAHRDRAAVLTARVHDLHEVLARLRNHDANGLNLIDAGVGRVQRAGKIVEADVAADAGQVAPKRGDIDPFRHRRRHHSS